MSMKTPDCGTCRCVECTDHDQPPDMRSRSAEECAEVRMCALAERALVAEKMFTALARGGNPTRERCAPGKDCTTLCGTASVNECEAQQRAWANRIVRAALGLQPEEELKGGLAAIIGHWPGDETDAEIKEALQRLRGDAPEATTVPCGATCGAGGCASTPDGLPLTSV